MKKSLLIGALSLVIVNCGSREKAPEVTESVAPPGASIEAKQVAAQSGSSFVTEFAFPTKSKALSADAKRKLTKVLADSQADPKTEVDTVKLIVWADQEYPSVHTKELPEAQVKLAQERGDTVAKWLNNNNVGDIEVVNMAKRPGMLSDLFGSEDHRIKKALEVAGIPNTDTSVKAPPKKGHAIVIVLTR